MIGNVLYWLEQARIIWHRHQVAFISLFITLLGGALRFYRIDANGFNTDEIWSIWISQYSVPRIISMTLQTADATPPVYYVCLHFLLSLGQSPYIVRAISALAGTLIVWFTFRLALDLFDLRTAVISACLIAIAPFHIVVSQVARAYMLSYLAAIISLFFFVQILFKKPQLHQWIGLVVATTLAFWTFYTTLLLVIFQNIYIGLLWLRRRLPRGVIVAWLVSQLVVFSLTFPLLLYLASKTARASAWDTITNISKPRLMALAKTLILFSTGDPSYAPPGVTLTRVLSVVAIFGIFVLGVWVFFKQGYHRRLGDEGHRVLFLISAFLLPFAIAFAIAQIRPIYGEKYLIFLLPPLFILFAWILTRTWQETTSKIVFILLGAMTLTALVVLFSQPYGEQWREAISFVRSSPEAEDSIIISPGYYFRPFAYYDALGWPVNTDQLDLAPTVILSRSQFKIFEPLDQEFSSTAQVSNTTTAKTVWFVTGNSPVDPLATEWLNQNYKTINTREFLGVEVRLLQRTTDSKATTGNNQ